MDSAKSESPEVGRQGCGLSARPMSAQAFRSLTTIAGLKVTGRAGRPGCASSQAVDVRRSAPGLSKKPRWPWVWERLSLCDCDDSWGTRTVAFTFKRLLINVVVSSSLERVRPLAWLSPLDLGSVT